MPSVPSSFEKSINGCYHLGKILAVNVLLPMLLAILVYSAIGPEIEEHDVFVSFRGADIRDNFLGHLRSALRQKSIKAFIDDQIIGGDLIMPRLFDAIDDSKVAVIIFSKNYAFSEDCLDELVKIVECHAHRETCIPVFYKVSTSDVMHQSGDFEQAFVAHEENFKQLEKVESWRKAMTNITNHKGLVSRVIKREADLIEALIKHISWKLKRTSAKYQPRIRRLPYFVLLIFLSMAVTWHFSQQQQAEAHKHDVFVNYYGEITLFNKLVDQLDKARIKCFHDREHAGEEHMTKTIEKAIEQSKVAVIILSAGYAYSARCLDELVKILDCHRSQKLEVVPVLYHVKSQHVSRPESFFGEAFGIHTERRGRRKMRQWQMAMTEAAKLIIPRGPQRNHIRNRDEFSFIPGIVEAMREFVPAVSKSSAGVQKDPVSYTYKLCLTVVSFLVSLVVLILSNEMLTQSLMGGEIIRKTQCRPL